MGSDRQMQSLSIRSLVLLLALAIIWGTTFLFAEIALTEVSPITLTLHRVLWAVPVLGAFLYQKRYKIPSDFRFWFGCFVMGALNNALPFSLIFWSQTQIASGLAAILNSTTSVFAILIAALFLKDEPLTTKKIFGGILGVSGAVLIIGPTDLHNLDLLSIAQMAMLAATISYAFAGVWSRLSLSGYHPLLNAFGMLTATTFLMTPIVIFTDGTPSFMFSTPVWASIIAISVFCTALAYVLYFEIIKLSGASNALLVTLLIPIFAVTAGHVFLEEVIEKIDFVGFGIIILGFVVIDGRLTKFSTASNPVLKIKSK